MTTVVLEQISKNFDAEAAATVSKELEATVFPLVANNEERIHLALIYLSQGSIARFREHLLWAKNDWRDTLVASGLGNANWREVLAKRGIVLREA